MASTFSNVLSVEEIDLLLNMVEVNDARLQLTPNTNKVDFTMHLSDTVKQALLDRLGLNLQNVVDVPFRWIRGDTVAHADQAKDGQPFDNTYLIYLTDSEGTLDVDGQSYPIAKGTGYVFSEGLMHGTSNADANVEPRLLLGPMNNSGVRVGATAITVAGGNIYIRQGEYDIEYSLDQEEWYEITFWPCTIINLTPESAPIFVSFTTDIIMLNNNYYFIVESESIFIGDIMLRPDGSRPIITIADSNAYPGLVQNGTSSSEGHSRIIILNLEIEARDSTLANEAGWFAQAHYGGNSGLGEFIPNLIINCSTSAPIANNCGGIAGSNLAKDGGYIQIIGCYTTGTIGENAGGIIGIRAGENGGGVYVARCSSSGLIGDSAGGIAGVYCGGHNGNIEILNCYSTGEISIRGGGIVGMYCSTDDVSQFGTTEIYRCYSNGTIGEDAGGIVGSTPGGWTVRTDETGFTIEVTNCFSTGAISSASFSGGIYGRSFKSASQFAQYCYTSGLKTGDTTGGIYGGSPSDVLTNSENNYSEENNSGAGWTDSTAKSTLIGTPTTTLYGLHWSQPDGFNTPFKLSASWFSPYVFYVESIFQDAIEFEETIVSGEQTVAPGVPGFTYKLLQVNGQMPFNFPELSLNTETGAISTGISKDTRIYEICIYSTRNPYAIALLTLTVTPSVIKECYAGNLCIKGKKFVGGNRDASAVISARTTKVLTNLKTIDPKEKSDAVNVQNRQQALTRVRAGGYMVPKKVTGKYLNQ